MDVGVLKAVSTWRQPVDEKTIAATVDLLQAKAREPAVTGQGLKESLSRLTELRFLQAHPSDRAPRYSTHPFIGQYYYRAMGEDALLVHRGASAYLERELSAHEYRVEILGTIRTRGAFTTRAPGGPPTTDPVVLDLLEELLYHVLKAGRPAEAYRLYRERLGGYEHLSVRVGDPARGARIVSLFLPPAPTAPAPGSFPWLEDLGAEHERYAAALEVTIPPGAPPPPYS